MERGGSRLHLCFSFNGLTGCVQAQAPTCFLAVRGGGVRVEKNVKVLQQLLREAASAGLVQYLSKV